MKRIITLASAFAVSFFSCAGADGGATATLTVVVTEVRHERGGDIIVALYKGQENWVKRDRVLAHKEAAVSGEKVQVRFEGLSHGDDYAVFVYHDQNSNTKLDFSLFPLPRPKEGVAVSNNAVRFGKPYYEQARFEISGDRTMTLPMHY